jgi:hypothetical protein
LKNNRLCRFSKLKFIFRVSFCRCMCVCHLVAEYMTCTVSFGNSNFLKKAVFCTNTQLSQTQHTQQERGTSESNGLNISSVIFIVVPCMLFQSLLYCSNSCSSLHFKTLKSHTKTLKICPYMFRSPLKWTP